MLRLARPFSQVIRHSQRSLATKTSTGIVGLEVHADPLPALQETLKHTLSLLSTIPSSSVYRQGAEASIKHTLSVVESAKGDVKAVENQLDLGEIEEVLTSAEREQNLVGKMIEWKA